MAALVAGLLAHAGDRPAWLAAILADRFRAGVVLFAAVLALVAAGSLAVAGGMLVRPLLTPRAAGLLLAMALTLQGAAQFWPARAPDRLAGWRLPAPLTAFAGLAIQFAGDGLQFIVFALAAGTAWPWAAVAGATLGGLAAIAPAAVMGEARWLRLPRTAVRRGAGVPLLLAGLGLGLTTLGLV